MSSPWDPLPLPTNGDIDQNRVFESIGKIINEWEHLEFEVARLYSIFAGDPDGNALRDYGAGSTISKRIELLESIAVSWFVRRPDQTREGTLHHLAREVEGFARRRNEVAHGIVFPVSNFTFFRETSTLPAGTTQYAVIPAYQILKHYNPNGVPGYLYTSENMLTLWHGIASLYIRFGDFRKSLML